ncbi:hypothetical protein F0L74_31415 [Chitinophaga agrisoli]|uniref:Methylamine utilisation protein MauE domain-containing protein n=1 Tax=Chitinophaga agrisoli TaxID=2607653 RepID=A0A5B2VR48_9BACT|nr:MauE/DoxX family redox-associated membrane protein [Chitinophaga agrisoli]KAA2240657.1 hypothetical protein F0L74_31415 [Chitinophaga agrisoli]
MSKKLMTEIIAGLFILLFLYTALSKLNEFALFKHFLWTSPLIGRKANIVAWVVPAVEILVSLLLFLPATRRRGLYASFMLMLAFTIYLAYMIIFVPKLPCSCGGVISQLSWQQHLIFNIVFTILSVVGIRLSKAVPASNHVSLS